tara:strand:+ start:4664 stop:5668 length:1005 start_codon:yes stop_codon:yes gene_type:complete
MILKSFIVEKNISLLEKYSVSLIYGENIGMKDDIKNEIKKHFKEYEQISFNQSDVTKNENLLDEHANNISLFSKKKLIFIGEVSEKIKSKIVKILENPNPDLKIFLFAQNLEKKSLVREMFEKEKMTGIVACYQDNQRTLAEYLRKKLYGYSGLSQEVINFLINNSGLDRKTLSYEIDKIKSLFLDKKIKFEKLPEVLNNVHNLDFDSVRDACLGGEKESLNKNLGNVMLQNEDAYFYLNSLSRRIQKLHDLNNQYDKDKNIEKAVDNIRPPIFWKDKPIFFKQMKRWNVKKLLEAKESLFNTEVLIKTNSNSNNNTLIKNLIINLYNKAASIS